MLEESVVPARIYPNSRFHLVQSLPPSAVADDPCGFEELSDISGVGAWYWAQPHASKDCAEARGCVSGREPQSCSVFSFKEKTP